MCKTRRQYVGGLDNKQSRVGLRPPEQFKFSICWPVYIVEILGKQGRVQI